MSLIPTRVLDNFINHIYRFFRDCLDEDLAQYGQVDLEAIQPTSTQFKEVQKHAVSAFQAVADSPADEAAQDEDEESEEEDEEDEEEDEEGEDKMDGSGHEDEDEDMAGQEGSCGGNKRTD